MTSRPFHRDIGSAFAPPSFVDSISALYGAITGDHS